MSIGQKSWQYAGTAKRRNTRNLTIFLLISAVAALLGVVAWLMMPALQPAAESWLVRMPVVLPQKKDGALEPYKRLPNVAGLVSDQKIQQLFDEIRDADENCFAARTIESVKLDRLNARDQVVIYCAQQAQVTYDEDDEELDVMFGWQPNITYLRDTLNELQGCKAQVLLLLDLPTCQPGLATGQLADDVCFVIKRLAKESNNDNLHVVASRAEGQENPLHTIDDAQHRHKYDGTRFAHVLEEQLTEASLVSTGAVTSKELLETLRQQLESVQLLTGSEDALGNIKLSLRPPPAVEETQSSTEENVAANSASDDAPAETSNEEDQLATWKQQWTDWSDTAVVHLEQDWLKFTRAIALAELSRGHGRNDFDDAVQTVYRKLKQEWDDQTKGQRPWNNPAISNCMSVTNAMLQTSSVETAAAEEPASERDEIHRLQELLELEPQDSKHFGTLCPENNPERVAFVNEWIADLNKEWDQQRLNQMQAVLHEMRGNRNWKRNWPKEDWPHELVTIDYVLTRISADADIANVTQTLTGLLHQQQMVCALACGHRSLDVSEPANRPILKAVWNGQKNQLQESQNKLCEAREWLTLGKSGVEFAKRLLEEGCPDFVQQCHDECFHLRMRSECFFQLQTQTLQAARDAAEPSSDKLDQLESLAGDLQRDKKNWPEESQKLAAKLFQLCAGMSHANHNSDHGEVHLPFLQTPNILLPAADKERGNSLEVFLGYFSTMLLKQKKEQVGSDLLDQWKDVIGQLKNSASETVETDKPEGLIIARTKLAQTLQKQWTEYFADLSAPELSQEYVSRDAIEHGQSLIENLAKTESATPTDQQSKSVSMEGTNVTLLVAANEDDSVYVFLPDDCPLQLSDLSSGKQKDKYWVLSPEKLNGAVRLTTQQPLEKGTSVLVAKAASGDDGIPRLRDYQRYQIQVDNSTKWKPEFLYTDKSVDPPKDKSFDIRTDAGVFDWQLPPSTTHYTEYQNIKIRLCQIAGASTHVTVRGKFSQDDWIDLLEKKPLINGNSDLKRFIDILPPAVAEGTGPQPATLSIWDIRDGFEFQVTPWNGDQELAKQTIKVEPRFQRPEDFVEVNPEWNESNKTLTVQVKRKDSRNISPKKLDWSVHFNPQLMRFLQTDSDRLTLDMVADMELTKTKEYVYRFDEMGENINREFAVSVAGVPYYWWWTLPQKPAVRVEPLKQPFVRSLLILESLAEKPSSGKESAQKPQDRFYLLQKPTEDDESALPFSLAIIASDKSPISEQTKLTVKYRGKNGRLSSFPLTDFKSTIRCNYRETAQLSRSVSGHWTLKTARKWHEWPADADQLMDGEGRYEVRAEIELADQQVTDQHPPIIVIDRSPPMIDVRLMADGEIILKETSIPSKSKRINGRLTVTVADEQSEIREVQIKWPGSKKPQVVSGAGPFERALTGLPLLKTDEPLTMQILVQATNTAGLESTLDREWKYLYEPDTGQVIIKWKNKPLQRTLVLRGLSTSFQKRQTGVSEVTFDGVPFAKGYLLQQGNRTVPGQENISFIEDGQTIELD